MDHRSELIDKKKEKARRTDIQNKDVAKSKKDMVYLNKKSVQIFVLCILLGF